MAESATITGALLIDATEKAILIESKGKRYWIPRSQIDYIRKEKPTQAGRVCTLHIPEWLAQEKGLDYE